MSFLASILKSNEYKSLLKLSKDTSGIFTVVEEKRKDNTLFKRSTLSNKVNNKYTTRTIDEYDSDGVTIKKTTTFTLSYDESGNVISEIIQ